MKVNKKNMITMAFTILLLFSICLGSLAAEAYFYNAKLYPTQYSVVKGVSKTNAGTYGTLSLESINAAVGGSYNKSYVYVRVGANGTTYSAYAGASINLPLTGSYQTPSVYVPLYGKSADTYNNCFISGYWNAH